MERDDSIVAVGEVIVLSVTLSAAVAEALLFDADRSSTSPSAIIEAKLEAAYGLDRQVEAAAPA